ncbi:hypothetical protein [Agromyces sp. NPDC058104]|uniref:hypothetical protein n=1 Tax=Agromyces sp. NPDC058104 TaxID=3346342 RepID=UPI0036D7DA80
MSFPARFPGRCAECGGKIHEGEQIQSPPEGQVTGVYRHVVCPEPIDPARPAAHEEQCSECFMIHPKGACDA